MLVHFDTMPERDGAETDGRTDGRRECYINISTLTRDKMASLCRWLYNSIAQLLRYLQQRRRFPALPLDYYKQHNTTHREYDIQELEVVVVANAVDYM